MEKRKGAEGSAGCTRQTISTHHIPGRGHHFNPTPSSRARKGANQHSSSTKALQKRDQPAMTEILPRRPAADLRTCGGQLKAGFTQGIGLPFLVICRALPCTRRGRPPGPHSFSQASPLMEADMSSATFLPLMSMPPKIGPMRKLPETPLAAMPETKRPG